MQRRKKSASEQVPRANRFSGPLQNLSSTTQTTVHAEGAESGVRTALIVEGGAMRGIFSAGVLDPWIKHNFYPFDDVWGVSAGASNAASYLGGTYGRSRKVILDYCRRPEFKGFRRFFMGGDLLDIDWLWDITEAELEIGLEAYARQQSRLHVVITHADTGEPNYVTPQPNELFTVMKCSATVPLVVRNPTIWKEKRWVDGGVSDSLPVRKAYQLGARKIVVIRSNPKSFIKKPYRLKGMFKHLLRDLPSVANTLMQRHEHYNDSVAWMRSPPHDCEVIEICPPEHFRVSQFTMDYQLLEDSYEMGVQEGLKILDLDI